MDLLKIISKDMDENAKEGTNEREEKDNDVVESGNIEYAMVDNPLAGEGENEGDCEGDQNTITTTEVACEGEREGEGDIDQHAMSVEGGNACEAALEAKACHGDEGGDVTAGGVEGANEEECIWLDENATDEDVNENDIKSWDCDYKRMEYEILRYNSERTVFRNVTKILGMQRQDLEHIFELKFDIDRPKMVE
ncbi:hypothetical protein HanIR_Chr15g0778101 [Helianthus annuus]|nr:hypothetical protein HanIR_Chr15g0778101 [Helianthus annuus]